MALSVAAAAVAVDQVTKSLAVTHLRDHPVHVFWTLDLRLEYNSGSAFSLFQGKDVILVPVALVLIGLLVWMVIRSPTRARAAVLGLVIGGACGNLADRLFRGHGGAVVDFIDLHWWPTFNVADACITVGCVLLALSFLRHPSSGGGSEVGGNGDDVRLRTGEPIGGREPGTGMGNGSTGSAPIEHGGASRG
ncbi:MAG: signal peptidase II [Actinomycetota bacterium]|nr:signal peptidase II [Actinomycetota bacterium]